MTTLPVELSLAFGLMAVSCNRCGAKHLSRRARREGLLAYCQRDTEAMVWIFDALR